MDDDAVEVGHLVELRVESEVAGTRNLARGRFRNAFNQKNVRTSASATSIPATFLRVTVAV